MKDKKYYTKKTLPVVTFCDGNIEVSIPWYLLKEIRYDRSKSDFVEIDFAAWKIVIEGINLKELISDIRSQSLSFIEPTPRGEFMKEEAVSLAYKITLNKVNEEDE